MREVPVTVRLEGVGKQFGTRPVLSGVDLQWSAGEYIALFGPNGAGKTTLLRLVSGIDDPTTGSVVWAQRPRPGEVAGLIDDGPLHPARSARQNLDRIGRYVCPAGPPSAEVVEAALDRFRVPDGLRDRPVRALSAGNLQRVRLAATLLPAARVLLLDEPEQGLDGPGRMLLWRVLAEEAANGTLVVAATHDLAILDAASRGTVISDGVVVADRETAPTTWGIQLKVTPAARAMAELSRDGIAADDRSDQEADLIFVPRWPTSEAWSLVQRLVEAGVRVHRCEPWLEDVGAAFADHVGAAPSHLWSTR